MRPSRKLDLVGQRFDRLLVISFHGTSKHGFAEWVGRCDCGNEKIICAGSLRRRNTRSCGCLQKEIVSRNGTTHGESGHKSVEYNTWDSMIQRCTNPNNVQYYNYGGRGIMVCERWLNSYENFLADMGRRPTKDHSLDRYPNNETGHYEPGNCRWATEKEQHRGLRTNVWFEHKGRKMILKDWADAFSMEASCFRKYIKKYGFPAAYDHYLQLKGLK